MLNLLSAKNVGITKKPSFPSNNIGDDRTLSSSIMTFIDLFKNLTGIYDLLSTFSTPSIFLSKS